MWNENQSAEKNLKEMSKKAMRTAHKMILDDNCAILRTVEWTLEIHGMDERVAEWITLRTESLGEFIDAVAHGLYTNFKVDLDMEEAQLGIGVLEDDGMYMITFKDDANALSFIQDKELRINARKTKEKIKDKQSRVDSLEYLLNKIKTISGRNRASYNKIHNRGYYGTMS
jgi:hypothetical protein